MGFSLFVTRKAKREPHAKLYAEPAQTQLKKYLFGKGFEHFARVQNWALMRWTVRWTRAASALAAEPVKVREQCAEGLLPLRGHAAMLVEVERLVTHA
jgi:hypothetical protein